jgi:phosphoglycerate dehydrogenase-like enzyme
MDVLIIEPVDPEVMAWLVGRHRVRYAPELAADPRALRKALLNARTIIIPPSVPLDARMLRHAPALKAVGRLSAGAENIDLDACAHAGIEVVRPGNATAAAEAEFAVAALLQMLRRVPVVNAEGLLVGRELGGSTIGLVGMGPAARPLAHLLAAFGARAIGYDPALHATDPLWERYRVEPVPLRELMERSEGVAVLLHYYTRYQGLIGERVLPFCRPNQVLVSLGPSSLFDDVALADVLASGRMAAAWFDDIDPAMLAIGRPLSQVDTLQVTPRVGSTTRESRARSAWSVARRIDELLHRMRAAQELKPTPAPPDEPIGLAAGEAPA